MKHLFTTVFISSFFFCAPLAAQEETATLETTIVRDNAQATPPPVAARRPVSPPSAEAPVVPLVINDEAPRPVSLTVPSIEEVIAELHLVPGGVAVVDAEDYKRGRASNLKDALDYAPGVFIQPRFGADESRLSIRGSGIQRTFHGRGIKLMQDGVPLNLADGGFDFQSIEPLTAQYVEVYRGANALEYGATTLGGAINFVSETGLTVPGLSTRFEYGSFDTFRGQISAGLVSGDQDAYVSFTHSSTDGFRDHSQQNTQRFFGNFGYQLSESAETRFFLTYVNTDSELPGNLTKQQLNDSPTQAQRVPPFLRSIQAVARFDNVTSDWKRDFELFRLANVTTWERGEEKFSVGSFWSSKELDHPILFVIDQVSHDFGVNFRYDNEADLFGRENRFVAGFSPTFGVAEDTRFANNFGRRGAQFSDSRQTSLNADLYVQNTHYFLPATSLVTGTQLSYAYRDNEDNFSAGSFDPDNSDTQDWLGFSPKVGLLHELNDNIQFFANVSRSFEPPSFGELVNANNNGAGLIQLDEQTATTFEIGTRGELEKISWDLAFYHSLVDNELLAFQVAPGLNQTVNAGDTIHQGVEANFNIELWTGIFSHRINSGGKSPALDKSPVELHEDRIVFRQNYLWNNFRFDDDATFNDNRLPGIPEHYYRAALLYEHPSGFYTGPNLEWTPKSYSVDSAETLFADSYALLGYTIGYRTERGLSVFVEGRNLTDEVYASTTGVATNAGGQGALYLPGDGRAIYAGIEWRW